MKRLKEILETDDLEQAHVHIIDLLESHPDDANVRFQIASAHDACGFEREAIRHYSDALKIGLENEVEQQAYIQLGSSYRCIGMYEKAEQLLEEGLKKHPENAAMKAFMAMTKYNLHKNKASLQLLFSVILNQDNTDPWILKYKQALLFYADRIDDTWQTEE
ncbi:tetratricopeptide repeat protein [Thalassobacillus hwangdonensis]|uniref:Tetratricopeptide repeat protein n=1 Tax=Thalassobacillus hwangdonensis TaxID=546108 RepID=A0ABW3L4W0_9BACI